MLSHGLACPCPNLTIAQLHAVYIHVKVSKSRQSIDSKIYKIELEDVVTLYTLALQFLGLSF